MKQNADKPNVLFIMTDQLRFDYLGCMGADFIRTPNLDRLASRGMLMRNCFSNAPVCAPARIGLATGLLPMRLGALDNQAFLPLHAPTYYQSIRDYGYRVGCVGKLDLAKPNEYNGRYGDRPCVFGWGFTHPEECEGKMHAGRGKAPHGPYTYYLHEKGLLDVFCDDYEIRRQDGFNEKAAHDSVLPAQDFEDSYIGARAVKWIENIPDDYPWYLFVSFVGPHNPFDPPREYAERCRSSNVPRPVSGDEDGKPEYIRKKRITGEIQNIDHVRRQYCAAIELIDEQIGRILDTVENRGLLDNTYIVFSSDHGEMLGDHGLFTKSVPYEPSLHVPLIAAGPGIAARSTSDAIIELIDINATLCDLAGVPALVNVDAVSFAPVLTGQWTGHRTEAVGMLRHFRCVRTEKYKYIDNYNDIKELYDLENDPTESKNIAPDNRQLVSELHKLMAARFLEGRWNR